MEIGACGGLSEMLLPPPIVLEHLNTCSSVGAVWVTTYSLAGGSVSFTVLTLSLKVEPLLLRFLLGVQDISPQLPALAAAHPLCRHRLLALWNRNPNHLSCTSYLGRGVLSQC